MYDLDSTQLLEGLGKMAELGLGLSGSPLGNKPEFFIGAAAHPFPSPLELGILQLKKKVMAGAEVVWTDPVFDLAGFETWMSAVRASGLDRKVAIIASVLPLTSPDQAEALRQKPGCRGISDVMVERLRKPTNGSSAGLALCSEIIAGLKKIPGVRGIHLMTGGAEPLVAQMMSAAQLS